MSDGQISTSRERAHGAFDWMALGAQLHAQGEPEKALAAFEKALLLDPKNVNAASACATLLTVVQRPQAAYRVLLSVENLLMQDADGAANLAIAAEACGDLVKAQEAYNQALMLDPGHVRALNNVGLIAAATGQWPLAISLARKCLALDAHHAPHHVNLVDYLMGAMHEQEALEAAEDALKKLPDYTDLQLRHIVLLALNRNFDASDAAIQNLDDTGQQSLAAFMNRLFPPPAEEAGAGPGERSTAPWDAFEIYTSRCAADLQSCQWRSSDAFAKNLYAMLAVAHVQGTQRDWRRALSCGDMLGLSEEALAKMHANSVIALTADQKEFLPVFSARRNMAARQRDTRIHVGLALEDALNAKQVQSLVRQLEQHDTSRFAMHVYLSTGQADERLGQQLSEYANLVEMSHMPDADTASRIRLDQLDVYVQMQSSLPWRRPSLAKIRVAPVQIHQFASHRQLVETSFDYGISDLFIHPGAPGQEQPGAIVRMPYGCWLALDKPVTGTSTLLREAYGLPTQALVLCALMSPVTLELFSFFHWMRILRSLPDAVLWLMACPRVKAANLVREAEAAGVNAARLIFSEHEPYNTAAAMGLADMYIDTLRVNNPQGVEAAITTGVPAITCAGNSMISRLSGSLLQAAGLPELITASPQDYVNEVVRLARDPQALASLRDRVKAAHASAPIFDTKSRIRELEAAWKIMTERSRAGLPPAAFDVPAFNASAAN